MTRRQLIVRDSLSLVGLLAVTGILFAVTLLLFRSFEAHRAVLAQRWAGRGAEALAAKTPEQAVVAYRAALTYAPGERSYELLLAEALGAAGHTEEAYTYFRGLWESRPGDGFINLQLARLAAKRHDPQGAIGFYRASIYGTWEGDGLVRRREGRLELARFLIAQHQTGAARAELLVAAGNAPDEPAVHLQLAGLLEEAGAPAEALLLLRKTLAAEPQNAVALAAAGRLSLAAGDFPAAGRYLERAVRLHPMDAASGALLAEAKRLQELNPGAPLPAAERANRVVFARGQAKARMTACAAGTGLDGVRARWTQPEATASRAALQRNEALEAAAVGLVFETELAAAKSCGPPAGDDALLLRLAQRAAREVGDR